jgi:perosamine synthetase
MIARKRADIAWRDIAFGLRVCLWPTPPRPDGFCDEESLVCLSVRSGFDMLWSALAWPAGSEVLVSAITIPDIPRIIRHHELVPVPVDLDIATLTVDADALRRAITPRTKAILVAHLYGSRMAMEPVLAVAREHGLLVIEDCAQAFTGQDFKGHPESDVRMFSFGPIKTATAFGGGVLFVRDRALRAKMATLQATYPQQGRREFFRRVLMFSLFMLALAPAPYAAVIFFFRLIGRNHDEIVTGAGRSFGGPDFFQKIRRQPSLPLRLLLSRRLRTYPADRVQQRAAAGREVCAALPQGMVLGCRAAQHTFWLFPIVSHAPEALMQRLWHGGFDAARGSTSLCAVDPPPDRPETLPSASQAALANVLYLPVYAAMKSVDLQRLGRLVSRFETENSGGAEMAPGRVPFTASR